jgi:RHS repeat-associated protein
MSAPMKKKNLQTFVCVLLFAGVSALNVHAEVLVRTSETKVYAGTQRSPVVIEPGNPALKQQRIETFDTYGNSIGVTLTTAEGTVQVSKTTYDASGRFPLQITNALGQIESRTYDAVTGAPTSVTDINGIVTQWQYDSFGRKVKEIRGDSTQTSWTYVYCQGVAGGSGSCPSFGAYRVQAQPLASDGVTPNGPWSVAYYDSLDRPIRSETQGFDGSSVVRVDTEYDSEGRVYRTSRPYYSSQTPLWTTFSYDAMGRRTVVTAPDGSTTSTAYNGLTTVATNALQQTQTTVVNSQGQIVSVTDTQNNTLRYTYDANGNLTQTTDPMGNAIKMTYDILGRKLSMTDPDLGAYTYVYNGLGQMTQQTDPKVKRVNFTYDALGRLIARAEPGLQSYWTYDTCAHGIGKVCKATGDNGYIRLHSYDNLGRSVSTATTIDASYVTGNTFDSNGRIATQSYPNGLVVKYVYTALGYLSEVRDNASNALYWQGNALDAEGHLSQQTYGNGVVTQQVYDPTNGRLTNVYAGAGNNVQNLGFSYDGRGNMLTRSDGNQNLSETFLYDTLNRLTSNTVNSSGAGLVTQLYGYNAIGNIVSRSDMGSYTYGTGARPHAVTQIALLDGGTRQYIYDANGNLTQEVQRDAGNNIIASKGRTETYTSFNMPLQLANANAALNFVYGPEHQRIKQIASGATTIYLHPDNEGGLTYEKDIKTDGTVEHRNFITAGGGVVALIKQTSSSPVVSSTLYFHRDNLGSSTAMTDETGVVVERFAYEPFGKRRVPTGALDDADTINGLNTNRGYTNHEHLDDLDLIHMNGRVYDPTIGRFISADPTAVANLKNIQTYNLYSYAYNNPMVAIDPSGFRVCAEGSSTCGGSLTFAIASAGEATSWSGDGNGLGSNSSGTGFAQLEFSSASSYGEGSWAAESETKTNGANVDQAQSGEWSATLGGSVTAGAGKENYGVGGDLTLSVTVSRSGVAVTGNFTKLDNFLGAYVGAGLGAGGGYGDGIEAGTIQPTKSGYVGGAAAWGNGVSYSANIGTSGYNGSTGLKYGVGFGAFIGSGTTTTFGYAWSWK